MNNDRFEGTFPVWVLWVAVGAGIVILADGLYEWIAHGLSFEGRGKARVAMVALSFFCLVFFAFGIRNRLRFPAVEVSEDVIEFGSAFQAFLPRKRIHITDIAEVRSTEAPKLVLELRSGARVNLDLSEVASNEREAVRLAIERRLTQRGS